MRLIVNFSMNGEKMRLDYRFSCISWIKHLLDKNYPQAKEILYGNKETKDFSFAMYFEKGKILADGIVSENNRCRMTIASYDESILLQLYNAALKSRGENYPFSNECSLCVIGAKLVASAEVVKSRILVKTLSPICIRNHSREQGDEYYVFSDSEFQEMANRVICAYAKEKGISFSPIEITGVSAKTTVTKMRDDSYKVSYGVFELAGDTKMLNLLLKAGIGSRRAQGFGLLEVIDG